MGLSKGRTRGKMEFLGPTVQFHQTQIILILSKPKIRLDPLHTSLQLNFTKLLVALVPLMCTRDQEFQFLILFKMEILLYLLVIGTKPVTR